LMAVVRLVMVSCWVYYNHWCKRPIVLKATNFGFPRWPLKTDLTVLQSLLSFANIWRVAHLHFWSFFSQHRDYKSLSRQPANSRNFFHSQHTVLLISPVIQLPCALRIHVQTLFSLCYSSPLCMTWQNNFFFAFQRARGRTDLYRAKTGGSKSLFDETFSWTKPMGYYQTTSLQYSVRWVNFFRCSQEQKFTYD
jgi:hypothetical protein